MIIQGKHNKCYPFVVFIVVYMLKYCFILLV